MYQDMAEALGIRKPSITRRAQRAAVRAAEGVKSSPSTIKGLWKRLHFQSPVKVDKQ